MLPTNVGTGLVVGQFGMGVIDGPDLDREPEVVPLQGTVTFTGSIDYLTILNAEPNALVITTGPIVGVFDEEGYLCTPVSPEDLTPMYRGVRLIATDNADASTKNWHYTVAYRFKPVNGTTPKVPAHPLAVLTAGEHDLATFAPVPSSPPIGTPQALALLAKAEEAATLAATNSAAALEVVARADAGEFTGDPGPAGLDGSNVLPTDEGIAQAITTPASATATALSATIDGSVRPVSAMEVREDFSFSPNGTPTHTQTGQPVIVYPEGGNKPRVTGGYLTFDAAAVGGGYYSVELERDIVRAGFRVAFTPWTTGGGLFCMAFTEGVKDSEASTRKPVHFTISPEAWGMDVTDTDGTPVRRIGGGVFATPLVSDSFTLHTVEIVLDRARANVYITLPDGNTVRLNDAGFAIPARFIFLEPFKSTGSPNQTLALLREWWATSHASESVAQAIQTRALSGRVGELENKPQQGGVVFAEAAPTTNSSMTLSTTRTPVPGAEVTVTVPPSGKLLVRMAAFVEITASGSVVFFSVVDMANPGTSLSPRTVAKDPENSGYCSVEVLLSGLTPGAVKLLKMNVTLVDDTGIAGTGAGILRLWNDNAFNRYTATMSATPL